MTQPYDAIVVGAGLGGLSAGASLARKGYRVLVLEKHLIPGGYASSFIRGRYEFDVSLHVLSDIGSQGRAGALRTYLEKLGAAQYLSFVPIPTLYRAIYPDMDITLPADAEGFIRTLCDAFPHQSAGIRRFLERVMEVAQETETLSRLPQLRGPEALAALATLPYRCRHLPRYFLSSFQEVLERDVTDQRARSAISQTWSYYGLPPSRLSFFYMALGLGSFLRHGASYVRGRSQAISNALGQALQSHGGELRLRCGVRRILVESGRVQGVVTADGEAIHAPVVLSNTDPLTTCVELIGAEHLPAKALTAFRRLELGPSTQVVYLGISRSPEELGLRHHEVFINEDHDLDRHYAKTFRLERPGHMLAACYSAIVPELSPPGTSLVTLTALSQGSAWQHLTGAEYGAKKQAMAESMLSLAEQVMPGFRSSVEVIDASTPLTNVRYAGTLHGAVYGYANRPDLHTMLRPSHVGPVPGLYFVGAWTRPGGGYAPALFSGQMASELVHRQFKQGSRR